MRKRVKKRLRRTIENLMRFKMRLR
ncbi:BnaAnng14380D [Brassica napus]|uniref:BnaAnng14380D protein n=1 Tax=Brassica napus TaxID=3708 RepID=A0A078J2T2_BRANA|nr:BnaAnng14380D [Brassica napus]